MGAWSFLAPQLRELLGRDARYAGRPASASPAVGALALHKQEQRDLVGAALASPER
jgi:2-oxoglutarate dehydrogenase E1 component